MGMIAVALSVTAALAGAETLHAAAVIGDGVPAVESAAPPEPPWRKPAAFVSKDRFKVWKARDKRLL
eukprot:CAMPEP_0203888526 /NCGR_PEP_ID=MMETSP0359-20131031/32130_1 /ASSEMBLY_ACC=CAM_ASM_000338 /TAXON_ID=268821 /ORGANISM="Scrippsiella Hangoei, Strain SHTV-5" /LENGTH=66 /DNA_ID=CAMNT_0050809739 /DNA_START=74 /DNA_END=274 /DNA_ORIENTATION=-